MIKALAEIVKKKLKTQITGEKINKRTEKLFYIYAQYCRQFCASVVAASRIHNDLSDDAITPDLSSVTQKLSSFSFLSHWSSTSRDWSST